MCLHERATAQVDVVRIAGTPGGDVSKYIAELHVKCADCGEPFGFRCSRTGVVWDEPATDVTSTELRAPMYSPSELHLARTVGRHEGED